MRSKIRIMAGVLSIVVCGLPSSGICQEVGPVLPIFQDYTAVPSDLGQFATIADTIAIVRIKTMRFDRAGDRPSSPRTRDVTKYVVRVVETLKAHPMLPPDQDSIEITRVGGQHAENGKIVRSAVVGFEDFQLGAEYVLFLTWNTGTNAFDIAFGPHGSYQLFPSGTVRPLGRSDLAVRQQDKNRNTFLSELRAVIAR